MSYMLEAIGVYLTLLGFTVFLTMDSLFFYMKRYDINKPTLVEFFSSFLIFSLISKVIHVTKLIDSIAGWYYSEPFGLGKSRRGWLLLNIFCTSIYVFFSVKISFSDGVVERVVATITFLIAMIPTLFVAYRFGSKLEKFEDK